MSPRKPAVLRGDGQNVREYLIVTAARLIDERGSAGLPVGVQVVARPWQEHVTFAAMRAIEASLRANPDYPGIAML
jgi:hypothetical protein